jgi:transcriptional regulator with XRE-family HTH domain
MSKLDLYARLQEVLIQVRRAKNLTQVEVANRLNKPQSFVSKYESGERRLDVIEFLEVCKALNANPLSIMRDLESNND